MYPRLCIDLNKLDRNLNACAELLHKVPDSKLMIVTKGICADPQVVRLILENPHVDYVADSRVQNLKTYADEARKAGKKTVLLRLPMHSEILEVVRYADVSLNSELSTIRLLDQAAGREGKVHDVLLMIDLGDLREGIFYRSQSEIDEVVEGILGLDHVRLCGLGVNLTCYGAVIPQKGNLSQLVQLARQIEERYHIKLELISGGNSSSIYLIDRGELPEGINNLRLGESFLLGNDTAYGTDVPGTVRDAMTLEAQIIEIKEKPSVPEGESGLDAFGQRPHYEDRGIMRRAIAAIGRQDADLDNMAPADPSISLIGGSSDHTILDVTHCEIPYQVGDIISFTLSYGGMLKAATSPYVDRVYRSIGC